MHFAILLCLNSTFVPCNLFRYSCRTRTVGRKGYSIAIRRSENILYIKSRKKNPYPSEAAHNHQLKLDFSNRQRTSETESHRPKKEQRLVVKAKGRRSKRKEEPDRPSIPFPDDHKSTTQPRPEETEEGTAQHSTAQRFKAQCELHGHPASPSRVSACGGGALWPLTRARCMPPAPTTTSVWAEQPGRTYVRVRVSRGLYDAPVCLRLCALATVEKAGINGRPDGTRPADGCSSLRVLAKQSRRAGDGPVPSRAKLNKPPRRAMTPRV